MSLQTKKRNAHQLGCHQDSLVERAMFCTRCRLSLPAVRIHREMRFLSPPHSAPAPEEPGTPCNMRLRESYKIQDQGLKISCSYGGKPILIHFRAPLELSDHQNTQNSTADSNLRFPGSGKAKKGPKHAKERNPEKTKTALKIIVFTIRAFSY